MNSKKQIQALNNLFGWVDIELEDDKGNKHNHKIKYSLGSMYDIADAKIDLTNKNQLQKPDILAKVIHFGLPLKIQKSITPREIAYQIDLEKLMEAIDQVQEAIKDGNPNLNNENILSEDINTNDPSKKK